MKKIFIPFFFVSALLLSITTNAQTWSAPILVEPYSGTEGNSGIRNSLIVAEGNPAMAYFDDTHGNLMFVRALDASGTTWAAPIIIDSILRNCRSLSLKIVDGKPAIAYLNQNVKLSNDLKYLRATDASGSTWGSPVIVRAAFSSDYSDFVSLETVNGKPAISFLNEGLSYVQAKDSIGMLWNGSIAVNRNTGKPLYSVGRYNTLQSVNGYPSISYLETDGNSNYPYRIKFVQASDINGTNWKAPIYLDSTTIGGMYLSMQIVNGKPAISYYSAQSNDLKYVRALDSAGSIWGAPVSIDVTGWVGRYTSLQIVNGMPAISYYDFTNESLKYVRASDSSGIVWDIPVSIDTSRIDTINNNIEWNTSLQMVNGMPAVSYYDKTERKLKYVRALDGSGSAWSSPIIINGVSPAVGQFTSLKIVNGNPALSYLDVDNGDLKYVRATDSTGTKWASSLTLDMGVISQYTSLQIVNANPAISYYDKTIGGLKYVSATDASGSIWSAPVVIDSAGDVGQYTSLQSVNGKPAISYYDATNGYLKYVGATDVFGTIWGTPISIDSTGDAGKHSSLEIVDGNPAIAYYDVVNKDLKYVRALDSSGTSWGNPITIDVEGDVGDYLSLQIVNGIPAIAYRAGGSKLKYVRASDSTGSSWPIPFLLYQGNGQSMRYISLQVVNGRPAIAFYNRTYGNKDNGILKYVRATDSSGITWSKIDTIDGNVNTGLYVSMIPIGNDVGVGYFNESKNNVFFKLGKSACTSPAPLIATSDTIVCVGSPTTLSISSGILNDANDWTWYSGSCGGTKIGSGDKIVVSPTSTTTYYVRGEGGCVITGDCGNVVINVNGFTGPDVIINTNASEVCSGDSVILSAIGALTYLWSSGGSSDTEKVMPTNTITYTVTGTDSNNCSNTDTIAIIVNTIPNVLVNNETICMGSSVILTASGAVSYVWSNGSTTESINVTPNITTVYTVTGSSLGCSDSTQTSIIVNQLPALVDNITACDSITWIDGNVYSANDTTATHLLTNPSGCDTMVTLRLIINNSNNRIDTIITCDSLIWIDGNVYSASNNTATYATTTVNGCDSIITLNLTIIDTLNSTDVITSCDSYTWIDGNTYNTSNNTATHTLKSSSGCDSVITLNLTITPLVFKTDLISACNHYTWIDGINYTSSNNTATYTLTGASGCDTIVQLDLTINHIDTSLTFDNSTITANEANGSYSWLDCNNKYTAINLETAQSFTPSENGNYAVEITTASCKDTSSCVDMVLDCSVYFKTTYDSTNNKFTLIVDSITNTYADRYLWDFGDGNSSVEATPTHQYAEDNLYNVCLTILKSNNDKCTYCKVIGKDANGNIFRMNAMTINVLNPFIAIDSATTLPELGIENSDFAIYPNPTEGKIQIEFAEEVNDVLINILNSAGEKIEEEKHFSGKHFGIDLSNYSNGVFIIEVIQDGKGYRAKVIKQ